ncbi:MAG: hypothetical protein CVV23_14650 [Ignavibacteriae bacterium HGW-Ignavibacteriae-2]|jgi:SAM-dependent methyltransferase|nr:MAG: hypothetical protein CVV23_14650 [Ignavibacteriae bacterium HGW-Ignavibacteriae-2]
MDNKNYYENFNWDEAKLSDKLISKIEKIVSIIPNDVKTILDVGCGDGVISNALNGQFKVTATDRSFNSLKYVKTDKFQSSADRISAHDNSYDLVFSSEMIEHLPDEIFYNAMEEFRRVSSKYILLTFPNNENIEKNLVECPNCYKRFNKSYHLRSLDLKRIQTILSDCNLITHFTTGTKIRGYDKFLSLIKHKFTPPWSWIPRHWTPDGRRSTMCPECGYKFKIPYSFNPMAFACDSLNILASPKKPYQLCVLFEKK